MPALRRLAGVALLVAAYAPLHRLLDPTVAGPAAAATRATAENAWALALSGTIIVLALAWVSTRMTTGGATGPRLLDRWGERIAGPDGPAFAAGTGILAGGLAAMVSTVVHRRAPTSVDAMAQLLHARAVAAGRLTVPLDGDAAAWVIQNGVVTEAGWASIYPPLHTLLLAGGLALGSAWLVGPVAIGVATGFTTAAAERLAGRRVGRVAGLLLALSPFWLVLGGTYSSHTTAAAGLALVAYAGVIGRSGGFGAGLLGGVALGIAVTARPWSGLVCGAAILLAVWAPAARRSLPSVPARLGGLLAGGAPFALLLLWWNDRLFGSPFRLGYSAAFGPAHGLGLHVDPWGNAYGAREAVGYTGADLLQLAVTLFESPLPALAIIGAVLVIRWPRTDVGPFAAWAVAAVAANALYWHHGIQFGPRMLFESVPAWVVLFTASAASAFVPGTHPFVRRSVVLAVVAGVALTPAALIRASRTAAPVALPSMDAGAGMRASTSTGSDPTLILVHGSWASRIASRLAAEGMRRDSIETALRRNDICAVDGYARWRADPGSRAAPAIDFEPRAGSPSGLIARVLSPGNQVRVDPARPPEPTCVREAHADRLGVLDLELLAWRFPPSSGGLRVARDLGPAGNLAVLDPGGAEPLVLIDTPEGGVRLLGYSAGMELLWGGAAGR